MLPWGNLPASRNACSSTALNRMKPSPQSKHGQILRLRSAEAPHKFLNPGAKETKSPHAPQASRAYGRLITASRRTVLCLFLKPGRTAFRRSVEKLHKFKEKILNFLCEPLVREFLYWLLWVCLSIEEYLIKMLIEE